MSGYPSCATIFQVTLLPQVALAIKNETSDIILAKVNINTEKTVASKFDNSGSPNIRLFSSAHTAEHYNGEQPSMTASHPS